MPPALRVACAAGFNALRLGSRAPGRSPAPALLPQAREVVRQAAEGGVGDAMLHAARLLGCRPPVHPGVAEQPPEELVLLERGTGEAAPLGGEPHVAACHLDERPGRQARQSLGDARPRDAQALRDVGVAAEPPARRGSRRSPRGSPPRIRSHRRFRTSSHQPRSFPKKNLLEKQQTHVVDHASEQKRRDYVERRRYDGPLRRVDFGPGSRDACRARHIEREREDEGERLGG